jgi:hypothetical protein
LNTPAEQAPAPPAPIESGSGAGLAAAAPAEQVPAEEVKEDKMDMWYYPYERAPLFQDVKSIFELIQYDTELVNVVFDYKQSVEDEYNDGKRTVVGIYSQIMRKIELAKNHQQLYLYERELNKILYYITNLESLKEILEKLYILKSADAEPEKYELDISEINEKEGNLKKIIKTVKDNLQIVWNEDETLDKSNVKVETQIKKPNDSLVKLGTNINTLLDHLGSIKDLFRVDDNKQTIHIALFTDIQIIMTKIKEHYEELTRMLDALEQKRQDVISASAPVPASAPAPAPAPTLSSSASVFVPNLASASPPLP